MKLDLQGVTVNVSTAAVIGIVNDYSFSCLVC